jgi:hypothetical protein
MAVLTGFMNAFWLHSDFYFISAQHHTHKKALCSSLKPKFAREIAWMYLRTFPTISPKSHRKTEESQVEGNS